MRRDAALKLLQEHKQELKERYGVTRLGIFGSVASDLVRYWRRMNHYLKRRIDTEAHYV